MKEAELTDEDDDDRDKETDKETDKEKNTEKEKETAQRDTIGASGKTSQRDVEKEESINTNKENVTTPETESLQYYEEIQKLVKYFTKGLTKLQNTYKTGNVILAIQ